MSSDQSDVTPFRKVGMEILAAPNWFARLEPKFQILFGVTILSVMGTAVAGDLGARSELIDVLLIAALVALISVVAFLFFEDGRADRFRDAISVLFSRTVRLCPDGAAHFLIDDVQVVGLGLPIKGVARGDFDRAVAIECMNARDGRRFLFIHDSIDGRCVVLSAKQYRFV